jgi:Transposase DDE domain
MPSSSRWRSPRCSWGSLTIASSWGWRTGGWATCSLPAPTAGLQQAAAGARTSDARVITHLAVTSPSFCDGLRLLDSTPVPCGQSRETARRSELAGSAAYGWCRSHSRYFWGYRLYLLCAADGMPICFELASAHLPERQVAAEMLRRVDLHGYTVIADKGFAGEEFEQIMASLGARFLRPDRKDERRRYGPLGPVRQWIESTSGAAKASSRSSATAAAPSSAYASASRCACSPFAARLVYNQQISDPGRQFAHYGH